MIANKWYCIAQTNTFDTSCSVNISFDATSVLFTASVKFGKSSINIASCTIEDGYVLSVRLRETESSWAIDLLSNVKIEPNVSIADSNEWTLNNAEAGSGSIIAIISNIDSKFNSNTGTGGGGDSYWQRVNLGSESNPIYAVVPKNFNDLPVHIVSYGEVSSGGYIPGAEGGDDSGSTVVFTPILTSGTEIAKIQIDGVEQSIYAPESYDIDLTGYATKEWVLGQGFLGNSFATSTTTTLTNHNNRLNSLESMFEWDGENIKAKANFYSIGEVSSGGLSTGESSGGVTRLEGLEDVYLDNLADGQVLAYDALNDKWVNKAGGGVSGDYLPLSGGTIEGKLAVRDKLLVNTTDDYNYGLVVGGGVFWRGSQFGVYEHGGNIDYLDATPNSANAWNNTAWNSLRCQTSSNVLAVIVNAIAGNRKAYIQVGDAEVANSNLLGSLYLNPYGGTVYIGKNVAIHSGNIGSYITGGGTACLPLTGGTMTGSLVNTAAIVASYSNVDISIEPKIGGTNGYSGISFYKSGFKQGAIEANPLIINSISKGNLLIGTQSNRGPKVGIHSLMGTGDMNRYNLYNSALLIGELDSYGYGLNFWVEGSGNGYIQQGRVNGSGDLFNLVLQPFGGNVLIGTTEDSGHKLRVNGDALIGNNAIASILSIRNNDGSKGAYNTARIFAYPDHDCVYFQVNEANGANASGGNLYFSGHGGYTQRMNKFNIYANSFYVDGYIDTPIYYAVSGSSQSANSSNGFRWGGFDEARRGGLCMQFGKNATGYIKILNYQWTLSLLSFSHDGNLGIVGNFSANGEVTSGSDERYKRIESYAEIDIETIANAPIINFKWTDREDDRLHLGSTAQYWYNTSLRNGVIPTEDEKLWTMGYGQIALAGLVSVAKKVVNHEERLQVVEEELAYYKEKSQMLEQQLNEYRRA